MIGHMVPSTADELERYFRAGCGELGALTPAPETKPYEIEMRIRLEGGGELAVTEQAATLDDVAGALDRARVRMAMAFARGMVEGFPAG